MSIIGFSYVAPELMEDRENAQNIRPSLPEVIAHNLTVSII